MASPSPKGESFDFEDAMGSASASYSPPGGIFGFSPPDTSPRDSRKKRKDRPSWVKRTFTPHFDGHLWRKYGQKNIKDSAFPRLYYRCSYRDDKNCLAAKLVQQENHDDPPLFRVTYTYEHTCNAAPVPTPDVVAELPAPSGDSLFLRFNSTAASNGDMHRLEQEQQYLPPVAPGWPSLMLSFDSSSQPQTQHAAFPSEMPPLASSSRPFATDGMTTDGGGDGFSTWDSPKYGLNDHVHCGDNGYLPDNGNNDDNY